ncbi:MAG: NUDIX hydrolase [Actinomycetota bacterium]|nr:NUDIX hydrolase [Actinomycetota bacterium]
MYTKISDVEQLEKKLGEPFVTEMTYELETGEFDMVKSSMAKGRAHDVTFFIRKKDDDETIAAIKKPFFPPGAYRAPSGAAYPGESLEQGAIREAKEETGLDVELTRYLARINATFTNNGRIIKWTTHIFEAREVGGSICPHDTEEIAEARWVKIEDLKGKIRDTLLKTGVALFAYRVALTDLALKEIEAGSKGEGI